MIFSDNYKLSIQTSKMETRIDVGPRRRGRVLIHRHHKYQLNKNLKQQCLGDVGEQSAGLI